MSAQEWPQGTRVRLVWNGYSGVPKWLTNEAGTVVGHTSTKLIIQVDSYPEERRRVRPDQVRRAP